MQWTIMSSIVHYGVRGRHTVLGQTAITAVASCASGMTQLPLFRSERVLSNGTVAQISF